MLQKILDQRENWLSRENWLQPGELVSRENWLQPGELVSRENWLAGRIGFSQENWLSLVIQATWEARSEGWLEKFELLLPGGSNSVAALRHPCDRKVNEEAKLP